MEMHTHLRPFRPLGLHQDSITLTTGIEYSDSPEPCWDLIHSGGGLDMTYDSTEATLVFVHGRQRVPPCFFLHCEQMIRLPLCGRLSVFVLYFVFTAK